MTDKQINKWLRRRFSPLGWSLVIYTGIMELMVITTMVTDQLRGMLEDLALGRPSQGVDPEVLMSNGWGYVTAVLVGFLILYAWKGGDWFRQMFRYRGGAMRPSVFLSLTVICLGAQMLNSLWVALLETVLNRFGRSTEALMEIVSGSQDSFSLFLYTSILAPVAEELLFRGLIQGSLGPFGKRFAIFGSAILFGFFHGNLLQTPYAILMGLVLGYTAAEYSLGWAIGLHMFNNLAVAELLTRLLDMLPEFGADLLAIAVFGGGVLGSILLLIRKRHQIREYREEGMDVRCLKCFFTSPGILAILAMMLVSIVTAF